MLVTLSNMDAATERQHMDQAISILRSFIWLRTSQALKHDLLAEFPQIRYDSDYDADDLPFWTTSTNTVGERRPHLIIPYTLDSNDMKFSAANGFSTSEQFSKI